jgi:hypothetical protein
LPRACGDFLDSLDLVWVDLVWVELVTEELEEELCVVDDPVAALVCVLEVALELEEEEEGELEAVEVSVIVGPSSGPVEPERSGPSGAGLVAASAGGS